MGELVALETRYMDKAQKQNTEEDSVDFAAATTATLGVPCPCLLRGKSFDESPCGISEHQKARKGDMEEEAELMRVLQLSESELQPSVNDSPAMNMNIQQTPISSKDSENLNKTETLTLAETLEGHGDAESQKSYYQEPPSSCDCITLSNSCIEVLTPATVVTETDRSNNDKKFPIIQSTTEEFEKNIKSIGLVEKSRVENLTQNEAASSSCLQQEPATAESQMPKSGGDEEVKKQSMCTDAIHVSEDNQSGCNATEISSVSPSGAIVDSSSDRRQQIDVLDAVISSADGSEPIYEGEECILEWGTTICEDREPIYEGEVVLAEQVDRSTGDASDTSSKDEITPRQGELISNFLKSNASQLTIYGLFCLQDGLKERELCVFFRNNHFNTMFKFNGELYILATDQGYISQPDLVWEKLNEVNGDTAFMTGNFKEFKVEDHTNSTWDEQNAVASTADYLASIDNSVNADSSYNSDLQLAIALQQQEFEQQPQHSVRQPTVSSSRLVTGPQVSRNGEKSSSLSPKQESKALKEKCTVM